MTVYHGEEKWDIEVTDIFHVKEIDTFWGRRLFVRGRVEVYDEDGFLMRFDFEYTGKHKESPNKLEDYLRGQALNLHLKNKEKNEHTLENYVERLRRK